MKFPLSWLKEHLDTDASLETITDALTSVGLELEGITDPSAALKGFRTARIIEAKKHPNADKLRVCRVDTGAGELQVVCGAPNARDGLLTVLALPGMIVPNSGAVLKKGEIRGEASEGMLCSSRELNLSDEHDGIMELPAETALGVELGDLLGLADPVIEIAVTPNRADALGVRGIARDLAAKGLGTLKPLPVPSIAAQPLPGPAISIDLPDNNRACPVFFARVIKGVKNGESPAWLKQKLQAVGLRPISALVDITNLLTLDLNRPAHVFDLGKLNGDLTIRPAADGESLAALNGKTYTLEPGMTVIADASGVVSLGGIIGGEGTGCGFDTQDVLLEIAYFDPLSTARTGRKLGVLSDARYRFERGIDSGFCEDGLAFATQLILDLCGGTPGPVIQAGTVPDTRRTLTLRPSRCESLGGVAVAADEQARILTALGFGVTATGDTLAVVPPSWRDDIEGEADLVEEVLRIHGLDSIAPVSMAVEGLPPLAISPAQKRLTQLKRLLAGRGLFEAVTWSFLAKADAVAFGGGQDELAVVNPIAADLDHMRPSALPNLLAAASRNRARGVASPALFEAGPGFVSARPDGQRTIIVGVRVGEAVERNWRGTARPVDAFDAKADLFAALRLLGLNPDGMPLTRDAPAWFHPGQSGSVKLGPKQVLGHFGLLHPIVAERYDLDAPVAVFELHLDAVPLPKAKAGRARPMLKTSAFQAVQRDFAFLVDKSVEVETLLRAVRTADKALISSVALFDVYAGKGVPEGQKSIALSVTLTPMDRTLTDAEIETVATAITSAVAKATGGTLRS
jgi:phenylalanyl-tRNA synthetase beta chain